MKKVGTFCAPGSYNPLISLSYCVSGSVITRFKPRQPGGVLSFWTDSPEQRNQTKRAPACHSLSLQPSVDRSKVCTPSLGPVLSLSFRPFRFAHKSKGDIERPVSSFIGPASVIRRGATF